MVYVVEELEGSGQASHGMVIVLSDRHSDGAGSYAGRERPSRGSCTWGTSPITGLSRL